MIVFLSVAWTKNSQILFFFGLLLFGLHDIQLCGQGPQDISLEIFQWIVDSTHVLHPPKALLSLVIASHTVGFSLVLPLEDVMHNCIIFS